MSQEEILDKIIKYLKEHLDKNGPRGYIGQDPYKSDFFELFREAYKNDYFDFSSTPRLTSDAIIDELGHRWTENSGNEKDELLKEFHKNWNEWTYAWDNHE